MSIQGLCLISTTSVVCLLIANIQRVGAQDARPVKPAASAQHDELHGDTPPADDLTDEAQKTLASLRDTLPSDSEARMMLEDIMRGRRLGQSDGWFRVAVSQTRYDWPTVSARYDQNSNAKIERDEFPGSDDDFRRLDRDHNSMVTAEDLSWQDHALVRSPAHCCSDGRIRTATEKSRRRNSHSSSNSSTPTPPVIFRWTTWAKISGSPLTRCPTRGPTDRVAAP